MLEVITVIVLGYVVSIWWKGFKCLDEQFKEHDEQMKNRKCCTEHR
jgi:hypothetical protein